jgi:hypothetical protein
MVHAQLPPMLRHYSMTQDVSVAFGVTTPALHRYRGLLNTNINTVITVTMMMFFAMALVLKCAGTLGNCPWAPYLFGGARLDKRSDHCQWHRHSQLDTTELGSMYDKPKMLRRTPSVSA